MTHPAPRIPAEYRDERGRLLPGNPGGTGRPPKEKERAIVRAVAAAFTPEELTGYLQHAMELAIAQRSPRNILAIAEFVRDTTVGRPVHMTVRDERTADLLTMIERLAEEQQREAEIVVVGELVTNEPPV